MAKNKELTPEEYFSRPEMGVKRGDLLQVLNGVVESIDTQLSQSFKVMSQSYLTTEVVLQVLMEKGLITEQDIAEAKKTYVEENTNKGGH